MYRILTAFGMLLIASCLASAQATTQGLPSTSGGAVGPVKDVTYEVIWLIESDDANREAYNGPAAEGLESAGYGRLVRAGSAAAAVTVGKPSTVTGTSRYGQLSALTSLLNTTEKHELQIKIQLRMQNQSPLTIDTTTRAPMGRWFLVGSSDSRVGLPQHAADGKRGLAIMRITDGVLLLDKNDLSESNNESQARE